MTEDHSEFVEECQQIFLAWSRRFFGHQGIAELSARRR